MLYFHNRFSSSCLSCSATRTKARENVLVPSPRIHQPHVSADGIRSLHLIPPGGWYSVRRYRPEATLPRSDAPKPPRMFSAKVLFGCELWPPHRRQSVLPGRAKETTSLRQTFLPTSSRPFGDYWRRRASTYDSLPTIFTRPAADPSPKQLDGVPTTSCVPFHFTFYLLIWLVVSHPSWTRRFSREASTNSRPPQAAKLAYPPRACPHAHREACPASA